MVKKSDWKTVDTPEMRAEFICEKKLSSDEIEVTVNRDITQCRIRDVEWDRRMVLSLIDSLIENY